MRVHFALGLLITAAALFAAGGHAHEHSHQPSVEPPSQHEEALPPAAAEAAGVVDAFQAALAGGDLDGARRLLDPQVRIFEGGNVERSAEEYASHHLQSDAAFLKGAEIRLTSRSGDARGGLAWLASESTITPAGGGQGIASTETMVLRQTPEGWRIAHIHWSSKALSGGH